ncbi:MAG: division/cell wall cluster transcriptional repressor MraZ [Acidobacteriota bacterium]
MLRGNYITRMDEKGRLKVPTAFRRYLSEHYSEEFYVTSLTGEYARIYPMAEWEALEARLAILPSMDPAKRRFLDRTNYYGQTQTIDTQGRLLIHPLLRSSAEIMGEVAVLGYLIYLEIWSLERFQAHLTADPYSDEDAAAIARLGI